MSSFNGWRRILICFFLCFFILHQLSVLELRSSNTSDDFSLKNRVKFDHLVLGPAAGQGLPNRLQCQGVKALNKTQLWTPRSPRIENGISFVTVFTLYNASPTNLVDQRSSRLVMVGNASYSKPQRSMAILNVFINFIQVTMPKSNVIILTDPASDLRLRSEVAVVHPIPGDYSRENLMLQRIKSYIAFLEQRVEQQSLRLGTHYIFTDSDMAVVDDLEQIFMDYDNFHVALTFRNNKEQPLNSGIIAVRGTREGIERWKNAPLLSFHMYSCHGLFVSVER